MAPTDTASRGAATREALIQAGLDVFGRAGYDAASSRALAHAAGVNQALIAYHFGGKHGLYLAVFEHVAQEFSGRIAPVAAELTAELARSEGAPQPDGTRPVVAIERILGTLLEVLTQPHTARWAQLIVREQQQPTQAFDVLYSGVLGPMLRILTRFVALATDDDADSETTHLIALMLVGQVLVFRVANATVRRDLGWTDDIGADERARIKARLRIHVNAILGRRPAS
ncbi:MAG: CerR family C-terminal domain-containing protein [Pseudomonadales bacterium]